MISPPYKLQAYHLVYLQLKEFRQAVEDRHTHLYQNPYYPPMTQPQTQNIPARLCDECMYIYIAFHRCKKRGGGGDGTQGPYNMPPNHNEIILVRLSCLLLYHAFNRRLDSAPPQLSYALASLLYHHQCYLAWNQN